jgi:hypothetical protein
LKRLKAGRSFERGRSVIGRLSRTIPKSGVMAGEAAETTGAVCPLH